MIFNGPTPPLAVDIGQITALLFFAASLALALATGYHVPRLRWWLVPVGLYLIDGTAFYVVAVPNSWTGDARMVWSVVLRLHGTVTLFAFLLYLYWRNVHERGDK